MHTAQDKQLKIKWLNLKFMKDNEIAFNNFDILEKVLV